jgi:hypothetical protein
MAKSTNAISAAGAARLMTAAGYRVTDKQIRNDIRAGAPTNEDGSVNLASLAAWYREQITIRSTANDELLDAGTIAKRDHAATLLGITERQLGNWSQEAWFPEAGRPADGWNIPAILEARDAMGRKGSEHSTTSKEVRLSTDVAKLSQAELKARNEKLKLQEREGDLLPRRAWELFAATVLTAISDWCEQLPDLIAADFPKCHRAKLRKRLQQELNRKRRELRDDLERKAKELDQTQAKK